MALMRRLVLLESGYLRRARLVLMLRLPLLVGHAVDVCAAVVLGERDGALVRGVLQPVGQAVAAEAGQIHEIDVLHVRARAEVLDKPAESRCLELGLDLWVDAHGVLERMGCPEYGPARPWEEG